MANNSSAGVYISESDQSQYGVLIPTTAGVLVGESAMGPVGEQTFVSSPRAFLNKFGPPNASMGFLHYSALAFLASRGNPGLFVTRVAPAALYSGAVVRFDKTAATNTITSWNPGLPSYTTGYTFTATDLFAIYAQNPGAWANGMSVKIYPNTNLAASVGANYFFVEVYVGSSVIPAETHMVCLSLFVDGYGVQRNLAYYINKNSSLIRVIQNMTNADFIANPGNQFVTTVVAPTPLAGGTNGTRAQSGDFINAFDLYSDPEQVQVNLLINGGLAVPEIQIAMDALCHTRRDCVSILDLPADQQSVSAAVAYRRQQLMVDSSYSALYGSDPLIYDSANDIKLFAPASGYVASCYAYTDNNFASWYAPAGDDRGTIDAAQGLRVLYDQSDRDLLVDNQINPIRQFAEGGVKVWGADTLQVAPSALSNMNVRRLMNTMEYALARAGRSSVFDPNDPTLWTKLYDIADRILAPIKNARGLYNYIIVVDVSNNPPSAQAAGDVYMDLYADPVIPAKRIHINAIVNKTGAKVSASYVNAAG